VEWFERSRWRGSALIGYSNIQGCVLSGVLSVGPKKSKVDLGLGCKVGCKAQFTIAQCYSDAELCRVVISNCGIVHVGHGKDWKHSASEPHATSRKMAARLSKDKLEWIQNRVQLGVRPDAIMKEHVLGLKQSGILGSGELWSRDDCLKPQDIRNQLTHVGGQLWKLASNQGEGVHLWTLQHPEDVFIYQLQEASPGTLLWY